MKLESERLRKQKLFLKDLDGLPEDIFVENQRGLSILGYPFFSSKLLIPRIDPSNFQIVNAEDRLLKNISNASVHSIAGLYPLTKDEAREKVNGPSKWFVLMDFKDKLDMDDQGWVYSWHFSTERWKSKHGFVRRRVWVKLPERRQELGLAPRDSQPLPTVVSAPASESVSGSFVTANDEDESLIAELERMLLDRERFERLDEACAKGELEGRALFDGSFCKRVRNCFQYKSSQAKFQDVWLPNKRAQIAAPGATNHTQT